MRWIEHGERSLYESDYVSLRMVDIEVPGGERFDHHVIRMPHQASGTIVHDPDRGVLMLWRHRFTTDTWGWEIPAGRVDAGESPSEAGQRETLEETGWRPGPLRPLFDYFPYNGISDGTFHLFAADRAEHVGDPVDTDEAERVAWVPWADVRVAIDAGQVGDGLSLTALLWVLAH